MPGSGRLSLSSPVHASGTIIAITSMSSGLSGYGTSLESSSGLHSHGFYSMNGSTFNESSSQLPTDLISRNTRARPTKHTSIVRITKYFCLTPTRHLSQITPAPELVRRDPIYGGPEYKIAANIIYSNGTEVSSVTTTITTTSNTGTNTV